MVLLCVLPGAYAGACGVEAGDKYIVNEAAVICKSAIKYAMNNYTSKLNKMYYYALTDK